MQNNISNYAAERAAANSNYIVEELDVEEIECFSFQSDVIEVSPEPHHEKRYDDQFGYGSNDDSNDNPFELSLEPCHRAFNNDFND